MSAPSAVLSLSRIRAVIKRQHLVALVLVLVMVSGCGRKPSSVDAPPGSITHTYPPVSK